MATATLLIRTPEGIEFSQPLAGPAARFAAWLIDAIVQIMAAMLLGAILSIAAMAAPLLAQAISFVTYFVLSIGYSIYFEWSWRGQTPGKRILRLRVVDAQGLRLKFSQVAIRNLLRAVDMVPVFYLVGGVTCVATRLGQRLGDLAANTVVLRIPRQTEPNFDQLLAGKYNSLRAYPHLEARLRQRVSAAEAALALQALLRRDLIEPQARLELFGQIAEHFRAKIQFPPEATEGVTDEQYIRNLVDSLYRPARRKETPDSRARLEAGHSQPVAASPAGGRDATNP